MAIGKMLQVVHYVNQFFGLQGQEEKAGIQFIVKEGPVGPGLALQKILGENGQVVATVICGDNYFVENIDSAAEEGVNLIATFKPDIVFAGPAFEAGRYGMSCGAICKAVQERLGIPGITGMYEENPGVELYRKHAYICRAERSAAKMVMDLTRMVKLGLRLTSNIQEGKLASRENIASPSEFGYFVRDLVRNEFTEKSQAERAVEMLLAKIKGEPFQTETEIPKYKTVEPPPPITAIGSSEIALISDGGLTLKGNPDHFNARGDNSWAEYEIESFFPEDGSSVDYEITHTGYHPVHVMEDTNRLVPVDVMRELEKNGIIGKLHPTFYSTSGNAASKACCMTIGEEIANELKKKGVSGAILTST
jgi:glycine reductase complex component B subunit gamma